MAVYHRHNEQAKCRIKDAFLELLGEKPFERVTVSELAERAGISRSTFYAHFANTREVFDAALRDFHAEGIMPLHDRLRCSSCGEVPGKRPFCEAVRNAGKYQPLVNDPAYFTAAFDLFINHSEGRNLLDDYRAMGLSDGAARSVAIFQFSGCYTVATSTTSEEDWIASQAAIDAFVRGGVQAVRSSGK